MDRKIKLTKLQENYKDTFIADLQEAFSIAIIKKLGEQNCEIVSYDEINSSIMAKNAQTYNIVYDDKIIGGVVLIINNETNVNSLELFFIKNEYNNLGLGYDVWNTIENKYPNTEKWITITPSFEERNIHFYVNKCGFKIVEFFNDKHFDPKVSRHKISELNSYFKFEKIMNNF